MVAVSPDFNADLSDVITIVGATVSAGVTELEFEEGLPVPRELMAETLNI